MAAKIASDQSTGTFVALPGETEELKARVAAGSSIFAPCPRRTSPLFRRKPAAQSCFTAPMSTSIFRWMRGTDLSALMTICIGGVFSIKGMTGIRIVDLKLPTPFALLIPVRNSASRAAGH